MNELKLSPAVYAICERSGKFRTNRYYDRLNVCNVVRSMMFVLLVKTALSAFLGFAILNGIVQLFFVMAVAWVSPFSAMDIIVEALRTSSFQVYQVGFWLTPVSAFVSGLLALFGTIAVIGVPALVVLFCLFVGFKKLLRKVVRAQRTEIVLGPFEVIGEYIASKHSKFCRYIDAGVPVPKMTYAEELRVHMEEHLSDHYHRLQLMSKEQLLVSIESNRTILSRYV